MYETGDLPEDDQAQFESVSDGFIDAKLYTSLPR